MDGKPRTFESSRSLPRWIRAAAPSRLIAAVGYSLLSLFSLVVLLCVGGGELNGGLSGAGYTACLILSGMVCCGLKLAAEWPPYPLSRQVSLVFGILLGLPLGVVAVAFSPAERSYLGLASAVIWLGLVGWYSMSTRLAAGTFWLFRDVVWPEVELFLCPEGNQGEDGQLESNQEASAEPVINLQHSPSELSIAKEGDCVSRLERSILPDGIERLEGLVFARFEKDAKQAVLHIPFSPPFQIAPHFSGEVSDGSDVRLKVAAVFTYGARLELKRNSPELPELQVAVDIYAESPPAASMVS